MADVQTPIIGADFLRHHRLLPDLARNALVDAQTQCSVPGDRLFTTQTSVSATVYNQKQQINALLEEFKDNLRPPRYDHKPLHDVQHFINTKGPPKHAKPRRLNASTSEEVRRELNSIVKNKICQPSSSQWAAPIVVVRRNNKFSRIAV